MNGPIPDWKTLDFATRLRLLLALNNVQQMQLAKAIGCSAGAISRLCTGGHGPLLETVTKIAGAFEIELGVLLEGLEAETSP